MPLSRKERRNTLRHRWSQAPCVQTRANGISKRLGNKRGSETVSVSVVPVLVVHQASDEWDRHLPLLRRTTDWEFPRPDAERGQVIAIRDRHAWPLTNDQVSAPVSARTYARDATDQASFELEACLCDRRAFEEVLVVVPEPPGVQSVGKLVQQYECLVHNLHSSFILGKAFIDELARHRVAVCDDRTSCHVLLEASWHSAALCQIIVSHWSRLMSDLRSHQ